MERDTRLNRVDKYKWKRYNRIADRAGLPKIRMDEWDESKHERDEGGKFTSKGGGATGGGEDKHVASAKPASTNTQTFGHKDTGSFLDTLATAKSSLAPEDNPWRVTSYSGVEEFQDWHPDAKMHVTKGGSTIAVSSDGDIVAVCHNKTDSVRGRELIQMAIEQGGNKLDAYDGLFVFYTKCGFEPVSWCEFNEEYAPPDWDKKTNHPEDVIFYKYTGKRSEYKTAEEFKSKVKASVDYDTAKDARNADMEKGSKK